MDEKSFEKKWAEQLEQIFFYTAELPYKKYLKKSKGSSSFDRIWGFYNACLFAASRGENNKRLHETLVEEGLDGAYGAVDLYNAGAILEDEFKVTGNQKRIDQAIGYYKIALEKDPSHPGASDRLAILYRRYRKEPEFLDEYISILKSAIKHGGKLNPMVEKFKKDLAKAQ